MIERASKATYDQQHPGARPCTSTLSRAAGETRRSTGIRKARGDGDEDQDEVCVCGVLKRGVFSGAGAGRCGNRVRRAELF